MASRKTNRELVTEFAELVTTGAKEVAAHVSNEVTGRIDADEFLEHTKAWRAAIWRKLKEIEERLCPVPPAT